MISRPLEEISYIDPKDIPKEHLDYQQNRFAQDLGRYGHSTFKQFMSSLTNRIMGHEGLVEVQDLSTNSHCPTLNTDFYRLAKSQPWAIRKKLNPFKWLELVITTPLEVTRWGFQRGFFEFREWFLAHCGVTRDMSQPFSNSTKTTLEACLKKHPLKTLGACAVGAGLASGAVGFAIINETLYAGFRRCLAPARYIIRPSIELYKQHKKAFIAVIISSATMAAVISIILGGEGNLTVFTTAAVGAKVGGIVMVAASSWSVCLRAATGIREAGQMVKQIFMGPPRNQQVVSQFKYREKGSTAQVSVVLHGLNAALTDIRPIAEQDLAYTFALSTGTEAVFFPKTSRRRETAESEFILFPDLKKYPDKRRQDRLGEQRLDIIEVEALSPNETTPLLRANFSS